MKSHNGRSQGLRLERIKASPQFNGRIFVNTHPVAPGFKPGVERPTMRDFLCGGERRVPSSPLPVVDPSEQWTKPADSSLRVTWLGHSTLVIEIDGVRLLTDPVWGSRASPLPFAGPKRFHPPPVRLAALPPLDAVIVSHDHYDHLDSPTIRALAKTRLPFIASLGVGARLERWGIAAERITELDWWDNTRVKGVEITAAPAQHFSGRGLKDRNSTLWSSFHLQGDTHSFFYGADSGLTSEYSNIAQHFGPFDLVALEIGAYHPAWGDIHLGPNNAVEARARLGSGALLPIHWGTFNLAMHAWDEPIETVFSLAPSHGIQLLTPRLGQPVEPERAERSEPWWRSVSANGAPPPVEEQDPQISDEPVENLAD
jgi:L-ascorbate metabolism protein UlaG (beta-lactamase superfamily)